MPRSSQGSAAALAAVAATAAALALVLPKLRRWWRRRRWAREHARLAPLERQHLELLYQRFLVAFSRGRQTERSCWLITPLGRKF